MVSFKTIEGKEYNMINSQKEITLGMYCEYLEYMQTKSEEEDEFEIVVRLVEIFSKLPKDTLDLEQAELERLAQELNFIQEEVIVDKDTRFRVNGVEYMMRPNFATISTGERKLIRQCINQYGDKNYQLIPYLTAVMIRKAIATKEIVVNEDGTNAEVIKYTQEPLNSLTPEGMEAFQERIELFNAHLKLQNFANLINDFLVLSSK